MLVLCYHELASLETFGIPALISSTCSLSTSCTEPVADLRAGEFVAHSALLKCFVVFIKGGRPLVEPNG